MSLQFLKRLKLKTVTYTTPHVRDIDNSLSTGVSVTISELVKLRAYSDFSLPTPKLSGAPMQGPHLASSQGRGMEFDEVRHYQPGDDIRAIDWRVTARTGKTHTKLFREERQQPVLICLDQSPSMYFGSRIAFKSVVAARTASLVAWAAAGRGDRVGGIIFSPTHHSEMRLMIGRQGALALIRQITQPTLTAKRENYFTYMLNRLTTLANKGSRIYLLSDFYSWRIQDAAPLARLAKQHQLTLILFYDPLECQTLSPGNYPISDGVHFSTLHARHDLIPQYVADFEARKEELIQLGRRNHFEFFTISTQEGNPNVLRRRLIRHSV